jgi:hypothetical protein
MDESCLLIQILSIFNVIDRGTRWGAPDTIVSRSYHYSIHEVLESRYN